MKTLLALLLAAVLGSSQTPQKPTQSAIVLTIQNTYAACLANPSPSCAPSITLTAFDTDSKTVGVLFKIQYTALDGALVTESKLVLKQTSVRSAGYATYFEAVSAQNLNVTAYRVVMDGTVAFGRSE